MELDSETDDDILTKAGGALGLALQFPPGLGSLAEADSEQEEEEEAALAAGADSEQEEEAAPAAEARGGFPSPSSHDKFPVAVVNFGHLRKKGE